MTMLCFSPALACWLLARALAWRRQHQAGRPDSSLAPARGPWHTVMQQAWASGAPAHRRVLSRLLQRGNALLQFFSGTGFQRRVEHRLGGLQAHKGVCFGVFHDADDRLDRLGRGLLQDSEGLCHHDMPGFPVGGRKRGLGEPANQRDLIEAQLGRCAFNGGMGNQGRNGFLLPDGKFINVH
jgi:hypothetical protein